ncbi:MAG: divalent-cation tolerance protein CutA [Chlorobi bacterium]|jgi:periplasmic divalent cation tolerance protein|nr:divalent-cation tolerance protein CutA [Chlorobiota bacterium]
MASETNVAVVLTTISTVEDAEKLARQLLEERLIACSTVIEAAGSHYWWGGKVTSETEAVLMIKTTRDAIERLKARILELHPYNVPEFIVLEASAVAEAYAAWIEESTKSREN